MFLLQDGTQFEGELLNIMEVFLYHTSLLCGSLLALQVGADPLHTPMDRQARVTDPLRV